MIGYIFNIQQSIAMYTYHVDIILLGQTITLMVLPCAGNAFISTFLLTYTIFSTVTWLKSFRFTFRRDGIHWNSSNLKPLKIIFQPKLLTDAVNILVRAAGTVVSEYNDPTCRHYILRILDACMGLLLILNISGSLRNRCTAN